MKRRTFLCAVGAGGIAAAGVFRQVEPYWFELTHTEIRLRGVRPRKILHLSDLHTSDGLNPRDLEKGLRMGLREKPDLIFFTGDFVTNPSMFDRAGLRDLVRRAAGEAATFGVLGNHDGGEWMARRGGPASTAPVVDLLAGTGMWLLHNDAAVVDDLAVVGVGDLWSRQLAPHAAFAAVPDAKATILLCHNPDGKENLARHKWDLMLCGHTHGGQVRVPGFTPPWAPVWDKRFVSGRYDWEGRQMFITRGLGSPNHVRAFCRPEVAVLHIG